MLTITQDYQIVQVQAESVDIQQRKLTNEITSISRRDKMNKIARATLVTISCYLLMLGNTYAQEDSFGRTADTLPEFDCVIEPSEVVDIGSAVPGVIQTIFAHRSDPVRKGTVVAELESSVEHATVELSRVRAESTTSIDLREESAAFGLRTRERNQTLFQQSSVSEHDIDKLETENRIAQLQVRQEEDNKSIAELEYQRAQAVLEKHRIRTPVEGVVMERFKTVGEYVEDDPVLRIAQLDPLHVEVILPIEYMGRLKPGRLAEVMPILPGFSGKIAELTTIDKVADAASGTFGARLTLANPNYEMPGGLRCSLAFLPVSETPVIADAGLGVEETLDDVAARETTASDTVFAAIVDTLPESEDRIPELTESSAEIGKIVAVIKPELINAESVASESETSELIVSGPITSEPVTTDLVAVHDDIEDSVVETEPAEKSESDVSELTQIEMTESEMTESELTESELDFEIDITPGESFDNDEMIIAGIESNVCYRVGPIQDELIATQLSDMLNSDSTETIIESDLTDESSRYQVIVPGNLDRETTVALLEELKSSGLTDMYIMSGGDHKGLISLGLYSMEKYALARQENLNAMGIRVEIIESREEKPRYWVSLSNSGNPEIETEVSNLTSDLVPDASIEPTSCNQMSARVEEKNEPINLENPQSCFECKSSINGEDEDKHQLFTLTNSNSNSVIDSH